MIYDLEKRRIVEHQKAKCRERINFHVQNIVLQSFVSLFFVSAGLHYVHKRNVVVPLVAAPSAALSLSKLTAHEIKRRHYKKILKGLERQ